MLTSVPPSQGSEVTLLSRTAGVGRGFPRPHPSPLSKPLPEAYISSPPPHPQGRKGGPAGWLEALIGLCALAKHFAGQVGGRRSLRHEGGMASGVRVGASPWVPTAGGWEPPGELTVCSMANFTFPNLSCSTQGSRMILAPLSRAFCRGDGGGKGPQGWTPPERLPAAPR